MDVCEKYARISVLGVNTLTFANEFGYDRLLHIARQRAAHHQGEARRNKRLAVYVGKT